MSLIPYEHYSGIFARANLKIVATCLCEWLQNLGQFHSLKYITVPFEQMWSLLADRKVPTDRGVLVSHAKDWTAYFDNNRLEHLDSNIAYNLCRLLHVPAFEYYYNSASKSEHKGSGVFRGWHPTDDIPKERVVMLYKESSWVFVQQGEPFPFEQQEYYKLPKKRDRLTLDLLRSYAEAVGIQISDPKAYGEQMVVLYEKTTPVDVKESFNQLKKIFGDKLRLLHPPIE